MQVASLALSATFSNAWVRPSAMICVKLPQPVLRQMWQGDPVRHDLRAATAVASLPGGVAWMGLIHETDEEARATASRYAPVAKRCACGRHAAAARMLNMLTATELACIGQHPHRADAECGPVPCGSLSERARHRSCGRAAQLADAPAVLRDCLHAHARNSCSHATSRLLHMTSGAPTAHAAKRVDRSSSRGGGNGYATSVGTARSSWWPLRGRTQCTSARARHSR
jgi:hypothetical protein